MNRKGQVGVLLLLFIGVIVGLVLLQETFNQQSILTNKNPVRNETVSVASGKLGNDFNASVTYEVVNQPSDTPWKIAGCPLESVVVTNETGDVLTLTTDYSFNVTHGIFNFSNTSANTNRFAGSNTSLVNYDYCIDGYNKDSSSRGIARLIGLLASMALLAFVVQGVRKGSFNF